MGGVVVVKGISLPSQCDLPGFQMFFFFLGAEVGLELVGPEIVGSHMHFSSLSVFPVRLVTWYPQGQVSC